MLLIDYEVEISILYWIPTGIICFKGEVIENPGITGFFINGELDLFYVVNYFYLREWTRDKMKLFILKMNN